MKEINIYDLKFDFNDYIQGFLVTSGSFEKHNMLTAGWGNLGAFWNRPTMTVYIRKSRYTYQFIDNNDYFTCSFFDQKQAADIIKLCGSKSGRDINKTEACDLHPINLAGGIGFSEAKLIVVCRKLHHFDVNANDFDDSNMGNKTYPHHDFHRGYIGEIIKAYVAE